MTMSHFEQLTALALVSTNRRREAVRVKHAMSAMHRGLLYPSYLRGGRERRTCWGDELLPPALLCTGLAAMSI
jgi:hypothetical protein